MKITRPIPNHILEKMSPKDRPKGISGKLTSECQEICEDRTEKQLQQLCENYARQRSIPFFRQRMDRKSNMRIGTPDAFLCIDGAFVAVEFKVGKNSVTPEQSATLMDIQKAKGRIYIIRTFNDFVAIIQAA